MAGAYTKAERFDARQRMLRGMLRDVWTLLEVPAEDGIALPSNLRLMAKKLEGLALWHRCEVERVRRESKRA